MPRPRNRLILGDSLVVMNSLLRFESLGSQVQMVYVDPPYGVKFGSDFQPFIRTRDVAHNDDADLTREPEMVQAYRDTWELGLHSYLTYLRDRLLLARELLAPSGSIFVQISDENLHHVREVLDEVFGAENFVSVITFRTTANLVANVVRVTGPFSFEATIPTASQPEEAKEFRVSGFEFEAGQDAESRNSKHETGNYLQRMLDVLRRAPVLRLPGNQTVTLKNIRPPAKALALSAEAMVEVSSFEFRVSGGSNERKLQGSHRLAEGDVAGRGGLPADAGLSPRGAVRAGEPVASGGGVGAQQHCGGSGAVESGGVPAVPWPGAGIVAGSADSGGAGGPVRLPAGVGAQQGAGAGAGGPATGKRPDLETGNPKLETLPVAILFGPENGPLSERLVREAWDEAGLKHYTHL